MGKVKHWHTSILIYYYFDNELVVTNLQGEVLKEEYEQFKQLIKLGKYQEVVYGRSEDQTS